MAIECLLGCKSERHPSNRDKIRKPVQAIAAFAAKLSDHGKSVDVIASGTSRKKFSMPIAGQEFDPCDPCEDKAFGWICERDLRRLIREP
ncbi:hypothetical protein L0156_00995 [bacterium]|nr:hypothetical protein [bacterium]